MSRFGLVPLSAPFWREPRDLFDLALQSSSILDQNFGLGLCDDDLFPAQNYRCFYIRPRRFADRQSCGASQIKLSDDGSKFQLMLDVNQFTPDELSVKTLDNSVVIHGKHEEKLDEHGFVSREFTRRYVLPEGISPECVTSSLTPDGVLTIEAPKPTPERPAINERVVPIVKSSQPSPAIQEQKQTENAQ
ncbi:hypothetical protein CHUAL_005722 [Chamberlinius hualienensis]